MRIAAVRVFVDDLEAAAGSTPVRCSAPVRRTPAVGEGWAVFDVGCDLVVEEVDARDVEHGRTRRQVQRGVVGVDDVTGSVRVASRSAASRSSLNPRCNRGAGRARRDRLSRPQRPATGRASVAERRALKRTSIQTVGVCPGGRSSSGDVCVCGNPGGAALLVALTACPIGGRASTAADLLQPWPP